ncbi:MAG: flavodoxin family protein [Deltaproteobacteria bacterium]|nr:flavodoxin family protein [Deltaproteobacteria bacterium]
MNGKLKAENVLILLGSPRKKGNSAVLAEHLAQGAESAGAKVETIYLNGMKISPCQSCYTCQKPDTKGCAINDDMQHIFPKLIQSEAWVIASPVYWFTMTAQTKLFMDRCFALPAYGKNPFAGKRIAIAMAYEGSDPFNSGAVNAFRTFQDIFNYVGAKIVGMVYGSAFKAGEIKSNQALLEQAERLGHRLVSAK